VLAHETGVATAADPFGGSYYVEALTAGVETKARAIIEAVERRGGAVEAIAEGYIQREIARSAWAAQQAIERGEAVVVGVNRFEDGAPVNAPRTPDYTALAVKQIERLRSARAARDAAWTARALTAVGAAAGSAGLPLMEPILEAVRARATVGEITAALVEKWGRFGTSLTTSSRAG
jgi:methylmalonyl-CoA mutase N-terminal domain/subunit